MNASHKANLNDGTSDRTPSAFDHSLGHGRVASGPVRVVG
jgi:hypothetical protein